MNRDFPLPIGHDQLFRSLSIVRALARPTGDYSYEF
jgi:hypothetical protein